MKTISELTRSAERYETAAHVTLVVIAAFITIFILSFTL